MTREASDVPESDGLDRTRRLLAAFLLAWVGLAAAAVLVRAPWRSFFDRVGFELPWLTQRILEAGDAIAAGWGLLPLALLLATLASPVWLVPGSKALRAYLALGVIQAALLGVLMWLVLHLPLLACQRALLEEDGQPTDWLSERERLLLYVARVVLPVTLAVTLAHLVAWVALCRDALRLPRSAPGVEALRAAMVAALPIAVATPIVHGVLSELRVDGPEALIVSPASAAAGTLAVVVYGAAFWVRLRRGLATVEGEPRREA